MNVNVTKVGRKTVVTLESKPTRAVALRRNPFRNARHTNRTVMKNRNTKRIRELPAATIKFSTVKDAAAKVSAKLGVDPKRLFIRGTTKLGHFMIKPLHKDIESIYDDLEEYLANRVSDSTSFKEFYKVEIILYD